MLILPSNTKSADSRAGGESGLFDNDRSRPWVPAVAGMSRVSGILRFAEFTHLRRSPAPVG